MNKQVLMLGACWRVDFFYLKKMTYLEICNMYRNKMFT